MSVLAPAPLFPLPPFPVRRFSVEEYQRLVAADVFAPDCRGELLDGWITPKMTRNPPHDAFLTQLHAALVVHLPAGWHLRIQSALVLPASVPEPDLAIVQGLPRAYRTRHPGPSEVGLLVEVADSSLDHDRSTKGLIYAQAGVPTYWIANIVGGILEVYASPGTGGYQSRQDYTVNDVVPLVLAGQTVAQVPVAELLG